MVNRHIDNQTSPCKSPNRSRARRLPALAVVALLLLTIGVSSAAAAVPRTFFGISVVRPNASDFKGIANKVNAGSVRIEIAWPSVQGKKNAPFFWDNIDKRFRQAATYGLRPQPVLFGTPEFISHTPGLITPPVRNDKQLKHWQSFVRAAAKRYGPGGSFWDESPALNGGLAPKNWIVWNEQNARAYWNPKASPKKYAKLLAASRKGFDAADPGILMTVGGMFGYPENKNSIAAKEFLKKLYRVKGAGKLIDAVSLHPYAGKIGAVKEQVSDARKVMDHSGDRNAKIIIGEIGWASGGSPKDYFLIKNKKGQDKLLKQSYNLFLHKRKAWGITSVYWFTYRDYGGNEVCNWCPQAGLLTKKGKFKPAGESYKKLVAKKAG